MALRGRSRAGHIHSLLSIFTKTHATYFLGLSYRKGLAWARSKNPQEMLHLRPLDLQSSLSIVSSTQEADSRFVCLIINGASHVSLHVFICQRG